MKIDSKAFDRIHDLVGEKLFADIPVDERKGFLKFHPDLWPTLVKGKRLILEATEPFSSDYTIVKRERTRIRKEAKTVGSTTSVDDVFIISLLVYIGLNDGELENDKDLRFLSNKEAERIAKTLFEKFITLRYSSYHEEGGIIGINDEDRAPSNNITIPEIPASKQSNSTTFRDIGKFFTSTVSSFWLIIPVLGFILLIFFLKRSNSTKKETVKEHKLIKNKEAVLPLLDSTNFPLIGEWTRLGDDTLHESSDLSISEETKKGFRFSFTAQSGMNTGELDGYAIQNPSTSSAKALTENGDTCRTVFRFKRDRTGKHIFVTSTCEGGANVFFDGDYFLPEEYLIKIGVFDDIGFADFSRVVGKDKIYFERAIQVHPDEEKDVDLLDTEIKSGFIRSDYSSSGAIVMYNRARGLVYAAVLDGEVHEHLRYYTNDALYLRKLPKTIEQWRRHLETNYSLAFCSATPASAKLKSSADF